MGKIQSKKMTILAYYLGLSLFILPSLFMGIEYIVERHAISRTVGLLEGITSQLVLLLSFSYLASFVLSLNGEFFVKQGSFWKGQLRLLPFFHAGLFLFMFLLELLFRSLAI